MTTLQHINRYTDEQFVDLFGGIFEHSPWVAQKAAIARPFESLEEAFEAMRKVVEEAGNDEKVALILEHPELGSRLSMSEHSVAEQAGAGLNALTADEFEVMIQLNKQYTEKFNFPFIIAVLGLDKHHIMQEMQRRLELDKTTEFNTALNEIYKIARIRFTAITELPAMI